MYLPGPVLGDTASASPRVHVVMATYQGAAHLPEQIRSIQKQAWANWRLLVRDDGSTDGTLEILHAASADPRIALVEDRHGRLGATNSFACLLEYARADGADYVFCADQDDVWLPDKIERQLADLQAAELALGNRVPLLVHSDMAVVDRDLRAIRASFLAFQRLEARPADPFQSLLARNFVSGCALAVNRALLEVAVPVPAAAVAHDWWLALAAAATGELRFLPEATLLYRQHAGNQVGSRGFWHSLRAWRGGVAKWRTSRANLLGSFGQAQAMFDRIRERSATMPLGEHAEQRCEILRRYAAIVQNHGGLDRWLAWRRVDAGPRDAVRNVAGALQLLTSKAARL